MSFFGFDTALPTSQRHPVAAPGFGSAPDPFAVISPDMVREADDDEG